MFKNKFSGRKLLVLVALITVAAVSLGYLSPLTSNPANRAGAIATLDDQKLDAVMLTTGVTTASFLISTLPDDMGSSLADELDSLSGILMVIVCVLYLEKFLLTTTGFVSFSLLLPLVCVLFGIDLFRPDMALRSLAIKLLIFTLLLFFMIPAGVELTDMIKETFQDSIDTGLNEVSRLTTELFAADGSESNFFKKIIGGITDSVQLIVTAAKNMLSSLVDAIAVLLITACIIPVITVLVFLWGFKKIFGIEIRVTLPDRLLHPRRSIQDMTKKPEQAQKLEQAEALTRTE